MIDKKNLIERRGNLHQDLEREPYLRDKARILHSAFFRRLQAKKQILDYYINDFSRNRLTHSLEVAQIAVGICEVIKKKFPDKLHFIPDTFCIEAISLAHDLGHPPNGHAGEQALNYCMKDDGGFEGNAQTFRIVSELGEGEKNKEGKWVGLNLTRSTMLGVLKYPFFYDKYEKQYPPELDNFDNFTPPKSIFKEEIEAISWVFAPMKNDWKKIKEIETKIAKAETKKVLQESQKIAMNFFASIMDLADDIAYGIHDFEDGITLGLLSRELLENNKDFKNNFEEIINHFNKKLSWDNFCLNLYGKEDEFNEKNRKLMISEILNIFISNCQIDKKGYFEEPILDYYIKLPKALRKLLQNFKDIVFGKIIKKRENCIIDFQLQNIIVKVFDCLKKNPKLLPKKYQSLKNEETKPRILCDYLAGMTDKHLVKIYKSLFVPDSLTIFDRI